MKMGLSVMSEHNQVIFRTPLTDMIPHGESRSYQTIDNP